MLGAGVITYIYICLFDRRVSISVRKNSYIVLCSHSTCSYFDSRGRRLERRLSVYFVWFGSPHGGFLSFSPYLWGANNTNRVNTVLCGWSWCCAVWCWRRLCWSFEVVENYTEHLVFGCSFSGRRRIECAEFDFRNSYKFKKSFVDDDFWHLLHINICLSTPFIFCTARHDMLLAILIVYRLANAWPINDRGAHLLIIQHTIYRIIIRLDWHWFGFRVFRLYR